MSKYKGFPVPPDDDWENMKDGSGICLVIMFGAATAVALLALIIASLTH